MSGIESPGPKARRRGKPIEVWVTDGEKAAIRENAVIAGMSMSGYLRSVGLNLRIRSRLDLLAMNDLVKVNGDLGRVAGLLKLWLVSRKGEGTRVANIESMMRDMRALQENMRDIAASLLHDC